MHPLGIAGILAGIYVGAGNILQAGAALYHMNLDVKYGKKTVFEAARKQLNNIREIESEMKPVSRFFFRTTTLLARDAMKVTMGKHGDIDDRYKGKPL
ncbi:MAG: hypothetical protein JW716_00860 [Candidatus Aenigmarchaeota archaeon]|nr:hypothetical protein [Candidatus Aenigmarchaeota archaeon]